MHTKEDSLKNKTIKGAGWSFLDSFLGQSISFLTGLILARLLGPSEYGLIGIVTIFINVFNAIVDSGLSNALIRKTNADNEDYGTIFIVNMVISFFLYSLLFISVPIISRFFNSPILVPLCRVMGLVIIINATSIIQNTYLSRQLDFKTKTKASVISSAISGIIGILMAYSGVGVWALVGQQIIRQLLNSLSLWIFSKYYVQLRFSYVKFKSLWSYGWKILLSSVLYSIWNDLTQIVIGRYYSTSTLGYYTRANQFSCIFSSNLTSVVQRVSYPVLSIIQEDDNRLKITYQKIVKTTMFITFIMMIAMSACAKSIILTFLGDKWLDSIILLRLISLSMMLYPLHALNLTVLEVRGRSDLYLKIEIVKKFIFVIPIVLGIFINIYWMLSANIACSLLCYFINAYYSGRLINYKISEQLKDILPSFFFAVIMGMILFCMDCFVDLSPLLLLFSEIMFGGIFIMSLAQLFRLPEFIEIKQTIKHFISNNAIRV